MDAVPAVDESPRPDPWPRVVVFSVFIGVVYAGVIGAISTAANAVVFDSATLDDPLTGTPHRLGLPRELRSFLIGAGLVCLVAAGVGAVFAYRWWRRDRRKLRWGFLIGIPFAAVVSAPMGLLALGVGIASADAAGALLPSQNYVELLNDTSAPVQVRYCVKQDCTAATPLTLAPGHTHRYRAPKDDPTPDEFVVTSPGGGKRCALVPSAGSDESGPLDLSVSDADTETC